MELTVNDIARMLDISAVQPDSSESDVREMAALACKYNCIACFAMPAYTPLLVELLKDYPQVGVAGVVGFPSGATTTSAKVTAVHEMIGMGCNELDTVINIGRVKSGDHNYVYQDMHAVVKAAGDVPVKVILECHYLTDDEIKTACQLATKAGVAFVKTGTGWAPDRVPRMLATRPSAHFPTNTSVPSVKVQVTVSPASRLTVATLVPTFPVLLPSLQVMSVRSQAGVGLVSVMA